MLLACALLVAATGWARTLATPIVLLDAVNPISEGDAATLTGTFTDGDLAEAHTLIVSWGHLSAVSTFAVPATNTLTAGDTVSSTTDSAVLDITAVNLMTGEVAFSVQHVYPDDDPTATPSDQYTIGVSVDDGLGLPVEQSTSVTVNNVAPVIGSATVAGPVDEGSPATLSGSFSDPGVLDPHTLVVSWGDPNDPSPSTFSIPAVGSLTVGDAIASSTDAATLQITAVSVPGGTVGFSAQHSYADDGPAPGNSTASDLSVVELTLTDDDLGSTASSTTVLVNNVAPTLSGVVVSPFPSLVGSSISLSGNINEPGSLDELQLNIDWGDGTPIEALAFPAGTTAFDVSHAYTTTGDFDIDLTVVDDDTGQSMATAAASVVDSPPSIPTLGDLGLVVLALLLTLGAVTTLRRG